MLPVESLSRLPIFQGVPRASLEELCVHAPLVQFPDEALVIRQGEPADNALLLVDGRLRVYVKAGDSLHKLGSVRPGDVFGEEGLYLRGSDRTTTVVARQPSQCLLLTHDLLERGAARPALLAVERQLLRVLSRRIRRSDHNIRKAWQESQRARAEGRKSPALRDRLRSLFRREP